MANIPKASIKKLVKSLFGVKITDDGANEMIRMLEEKAREISKRAVENARRENRDKVTKEDIIKYTVKGSDAG